MPDKKEIAKTLIETRDARLLLEMACWVHDLDKASWPFACFAIPSMQIKNYNHEKQPYRSKKPNEWTWQTNWLDKDVERGLSDYLNSGPRFNGFIPGDTSPILLAIYDEDVKKVNSKENPCQFFTPQISNPTNPFPATMKIENAIKGIFPDLFTYHSAAKTALDLKELPWEIWLVNAALAGPDGIDSEYFKGGIGNKEAGVSQNEIPPKVATPFGRETAVLGDESNIEKFKNKNQKYFKKIWEIAFDWTAKKGNIVYHRQAMKGDLEPLLVRALGYTNRPTNDVNLWAHSYGVGAMAKALAAELAIDSRAAKQKNKILLFPLRSPELNLPDQKYLSASDFLLAGGLEELCREDLERQLQTKFKVLSVLLRDQDRLHVGRRVGDILGYHERRKELFDAITNILEVGLGVGAEIFKDHAGIHFLLPWCQDSLDAHLADVTESPSKEKPRSQELIESMVEELVEAVFLGKEDPDWATENSITIGAEIARKACDFDVAVRIGPSREPSIEQLKEDSPKAFTQGLLFLKDNTWINKIVDLENPRRFPSHTAKEGGQLCPVCCKRPAPRAERGTNENDVPCDVCRERRESRTNEWWKNICKEPSLAQTTIWASEAADNTRRVNLLTMAFDLRRWFDGRAFNGFWMPGETIPLPVYPAPARIKGCWEATRGFLDGLGGKIREKLQTRKRFVFKIEKDTLTDFTVKPGAGFLLSPPEKGDGDPGDWFLGNMGIDKKDELYLLSVSGWSVETDEKGEYLIMPPGGESEGFGEDSARLKSLIADLKNLTYRTQKGEIRTPLERASIKRISGGGSLFDYIPYVEILIDSPTRFQVLAPSDKTVEILDLVHALFLEHFGKVAHNMEVCVNCLAFKEKFPFYLALEAADRFVAQELGRSRIEIRTCRLTLDGLYVSLDGSDPAINFFEEDYRWTCLDKTHKDIYRSMVAGTDVDEANGKGKYYGWEKADGGKLMALERVRLVPKVELQKGKWIVTKGVFEEVKSFDKKGTLSGNFKVCCPRLSWAHLASPGERHDEQLSIPLLAFRDWVDSYSVVAIGKVEDKEFDLRVRKFFEIGDLIECQNCLEILYGDNGKSLPQEVQDLENRRILCLDMLRSLGGETSGENLKALRIKALSRRPTQLRNLIEEVFEAHITWSSELGTECGTEILRKHIRELICHPNGCGGAWRKWVEYAGVEFKCPVDNEILEFKKEKSNPPASKRSLNQLQQKCMKFSDSVGELIKKISEAAYRFETISASAGGRALSITYDLLNRVCKYHMK